MKHADIILGETMVNVLSLDSVLDFCRKNRRICPMPPHWSALWDLLPNRTRVGNGWEPPLPLILGAWDDTPAMMKMLRLKVHIEWAESHNSLEPVVRFLYALSEDDWFHLGD